MWPFSMFRRSRSLKLPADFEGAAERVCLLSERVARRLHHEYLGTEHMLLALLEAAPNPAVALLERCGVSPGQVREAVEKVIIQGPGPVRRGRLPRTPRLQRALEFARTEVEKRSGIGPERALLIGLAREGEGLAARALAALGLPGESLRACAAEQGGCGAGGT
jgi:ATP-dependent Clp protease ATP-binding subunit ClpC